MPDDCGGAAIGTKSRTILGIDFFRGSASQAVHLMRDGGLLVVPAAPALVQLPHDEAYREALLQADVAIADSAFMVILWYLFEGEMLRRTSGLEYFSALVEDSDFRRPGGAFYVMASEESAQKNVAWLTSQGISVEPSQVYVAPIYGTHVVDPALIDRIEALRPRHIVITVGGGVQERLGLSVKRAVGYRPAIHCIGAAIAFRSGDQVYISTAADRAGLGWLLRCLWRPRQYVPRYWAARRLAWLMLRYRTQLPPLRSPKPEASAESSESIA